MRRVRDIPILHFVEAASLAGNVVADGLLFTWGWHPSTAFCAAACFGVFALAKVLGQATGHGAGLETLLPRLRLRQGQTLDIETYRVAIVAATDAVDLAKELAQPAEDIERIDLHDTATPEPGGHRVELVVIGGHHPASDKLDDRLVRAKAVLVIDTDDLPRWVWATIHRFARDNPLVNVIRVVRDENKLVPSALSWPNVYDASVARGQHVGAMWPMVARQADLRGRQLRAERTMSRSIAQVALMLTVFLAVLGVVNLRHTLQAEAPWRLDARLTDELAAATAAEPERGSAVLDPASRVSHLTNAARILVANHGIPDVDIDWFKPVDEQYCRYGSTGSSPLCFSARSDASIVSCAMRHGYIVHWERGASGSPGDVGHLRAWTLGGHEVEPQHIAGCAYLPGAPRAGNAQHEKSEILCLPIGASTHGREAPILGLCLDRRAAGSSARLVDEALHAHLWAVFASLPVAGPDVLPDPAHALTRRAPRSLEPVEAEIGPGREAPNHRVTAWPGPR